FDPHGPGDNNKLTVKLRASAAMPGPNVSAELVLPATRIPGYLGVEGGTFQRDLIARNDAPAVTLFAENIRLAEGAREEGPIYVHVDGLQRAFVFRTSFTRQGASQAPRLDVQPAVRWNA